MNDELKTKLDSLISQSQVMLFIKGTPEMPQCGFSARAMEMLIDAGIYFESFDILSDEDVRQGLKEYKSWPTYPQLYVKGELMGGVDIMQEMLEEGEFDELKEKLS
ncbi:Grx4 family monothiol glutaredoxin [Candidatus Gracilibacteria bacterium 28_42_T64]|nr:Grx4 family monothiol glutaredoxin [Candidatus Gracilibacteria bacterium 28_42_T64]